MRQLLCISKSDYIRIVATDVTAESRCFISISMEIILASVMLYGLRSSFMDTLKPNHNHLSFHEPLNYVSLEA